MRALVSGTIVALAGVLSASGCLPMGASPEGRHVLSGRADAFVMFQPVAGAGEPARLFTLRESDAATPTLGVVGYGIYDVPLGPGGGAADPRLILRDVSLPGDGYGEFRLVTDAKGRIFVPQFVRDAAALASSRIFRVDLATDERKDYGQVDGFSVSPDGTRVLTNQRETFRVHDLDDREALLPAGTLASFVGNDVFLVSKDGQLLRQRGPDATGAPEVVASDVQYFTTIETARGPLLLLTRKAAVRTDPPEHVLFDVTTSMQLPVPGAPDPSFNAPNLLASPSGRYFLVTVTSPTGSQSTLLFDRDTGKMETQSDFQGQVRWRPGHDEVWSQAYDNTSIGSVWVWRPGQAPVQIANVDFGLAGISEHNFEGTPFTPDGHFWLSKEGDVLRAVRQTDDLTAPPFLLNTTETGLSGYWPLPDGRAISEVFTSYHFHSDISLVDPRARTSKLLASNGTVVGVGARRLLALLNYVKGSRSGDLTLIDLESGETTLLAENVYFVAFERPRAELDRLPAGARIAYIVHNRIASPYDGVWVTTLP